MQSFVSDRICGSIANMQEGEPHFAFTELFPGHPLAPVANKLCQDTFGDVSLRWSETTVYGAVVEDETVAGVVSVEMQPEHRRAELDVIVVAPDLRDKHLHVGSRMLDLVGEEVRDAGCSRLWVSPNSETEGFYEHNGFQTLSGMRELKMYKQL
jgi:ribosomal protein S18 acetylase RimI-like enzyme